MDRSNKANISETLRSLHEFLNSIRDLSPASMDTVLNNTTSRGSSANNLRTINEIANELRRSPRVAAAAAAANNANSSGTSAAGAVGPLQPANSTNNGMGIIDLTDTSNDEAAVIDLCSPPRGRPRGLRRSRRRGPRLAAARKRRNNSITVPLPMIEPNGEVTMAAAPAVPEIIPVPVTKTEEKEMYLRCPICLENAQANQPSSTKCGHIFCQACIAHAITLNPQCPVCNAYVFKWDVFRVYL